MVTAVKGDREGKQNFVRQTLDQAFADRVSQIFSALCADFETGNAVETAPLLFVAKFKSATDAWNSAKDAIAAEYPAGLAATQE